MSSKGSEYYKCKCIPRSFIIFSLVQKGLRQLDWSVLATFRIVVSLIWRRISTQRIHGYVEKGKQTKIKKTFSGQTWRLCCDSRCNCCCCCAHHCVRSIWRTLAQETQLIWPCAVYFVYDSYNNNISVRARWQEFEIHKVLTWKKFWGRYIVVWQNGHLTWNGAGCGRAGWSEWLGINELARPCSSRLYSMMAAAVSLRDSVSQIGHAPVSIKQA